MGTIVLAYHGDVGKRCPQRARGGTVRIHEILDVG